MPEGGEILDIPGSPLPPESPVETLTSISDFKVTRDDQFVTFEKGVEHRERQPDGLFYDSRQTSHVAVAGDDPATTTVEAITTISLERRDWLVRTDSSLRITADKSHFHIDIHLSARDHQAEVFSRIGRSQSNAAGLSCLQLVASLPPNR